MEEDIDDLLDEVESKYFSEKTPKSGTAKPTKSSIKPSNISKATRSQRSKADDDLNDMIRDICLDDGLEVVPNSNSKPVRSDSSKNEPQSDTVSSEKKKCFNLILGGSVFSRGLCTVSEQRSCDKLRCTSCDFFIVMFDNFEWHKDCDYLFFRNNVPDFQRLKSKLTPKKGCRAYACQCTWRSIAHSTDVQLDSKLKWVCGKHS